MPSLLQCIIPRERFQGLHLLVSGKLVFGHGTDFISDMLLMIRVGTGVRGRDVYLYRYICHEIVES